MDPPLGVSADLPAGATNADPRWQAGYDDGFNDRCPAQDNPVYASGWVNGCLGDRQCLAHHAVCRFHRHLLYGHGDGPEM